MHSRLFQIEKSVSLPVEELYICDPCQIREECDWFSDTVTWEEDFAFLRQGFARGLFYKRGQYSYISKTFGRIFGDIP